MCCQIPLPILPLLKSGRQTEFCVADAFNRRCIQLKTFLTGISDYTVGDVDEDTHVSFDAELFTVASQMVRGTYLEDEESMGPSRQQVISWLQLMSEQAGFGLEHLMRVQNITPNKRQAAYNLEGLIQSFRLADGLKNDHQLRPAIEAAGRLIGLPENFAETVRLPGASTLRRHRLTLDVCLMRLWANWIADLVLENDYVCYLLADSSPRLGREWLLSELYIFRSKDLINFVEMMYGLADLNLAEDDPERLRLEKRMRQLVHHLILSPVCMGQANCGLSIKWAALIWALRLHSLAWFHVAQLTANCFGFTSDMGTEHGIPKVGQHNPNLLWSHWCEQNQMIDESEMSAELPGYTDSVGFSKTIGVVGVEHMAHSITRFVLQKMRGYEAWQVQFSQVARLCNSGLHRDRIRNSLRGPAFEDLRSLFSKGVRTPKPHRFLFICQALEDLLPLRLALELISADELFPDAAHASEWINTGIVLRAIKSKTFWCYGLMLQSLLCAIEHVVFKGRSCICHPSNNDAHQSSGALEYMRRQRSRQKTRFKKPCPGTGLVCPEFAAGIWKTMLANGTENMQTYLLMDCGNLANHERDSVMGDFADGMAHLKAETYTKLSVFDVVPCHALILGHRDTETALRGIRNCFRQYNAIKGTPACTEDIKAWFAPGPERTELDLFVQSNGQHCSYLLNKMKAQARAARANEISVESLHRTATLLAKDAPNCGTVHISFGLRMKDLFCTEPLRWSLQDVARMCQSTRNEDLVQQVLQLADHPQIQLWRAKLVLAGETPHHGRKGHYKLLRALIYKADLAGLFETFAGVEKHLKDQSKASKTHVEKEKDDPFADVYDADTPARVETCRIKYAWIHFVQVSEERDVFALPPGNIEIRLLGDSMMGGSEVLDDSFVDDGDVSLDVLPQASNAVPRELFKILNLEPKRRKRATGSFDTRSECVAVERMMVDSQDYATKSLLVSTKAFERDYSTELMNAAVFRRFSYNVLLESLYRCKLSSELTYHFSGLPLTAACHSKVGHGVLTKMVSAGAYPGPGKWYSAPDDLSKDQQAVMQELVDEDLLERHGTHHFKISNQGMAHLKHSTRASGFQALLKDKPENEATLEWSHHQLLSQLCSEGWQLTGKTERQVACVRLSRLRQPAGSIYMNRKLELSKAYLLCLVLRKRLAHKGVRTIQHFQRNAYYLNLLSLVMPKSDTGKFVAEGENLVDHGNESRPAADEVDLAEEEEGEHSDTDMQNPLSLRATDSTSTVDFGPFTFSVVRTQANHQTFTEWTVTCPFHADKNDGSTRCRKSKRFAGDVQRDEHLRQLKHWCLQGRKVRGRAKPAKDCHLHVDFGCPLYSHNQLDSMLREALAADTWIQPASGAPAPESSDSSSSSSSSAS